MSSGTAAATGLSTPERLEALFADFACYGTVGLAVSGGSDSVAMMRLAQAWVQGRRASGRPAPTLVVITVDHGLRSGSAAEARAVGQWANDLGLAHEVLVWKGCKPESGIQETAREARYDLMISWAAQRQATGAVALALAHHVEDQAETVLMRLARGSGVDGLAAMRALTRRDGVDILRPLLDVSKADLVGYLEEVGASWIEDPSNQSPEFERVRLRAERSSRERIGLGDQALALTARRLARASDALSAATDAFLADLMADQPLLAQGGVIWPKQPRVPDEVVIRGLGRVLEACGGSGRDRLELAAVERLTTRLASDAFAGATLGRCQVSCLPVGLVIHRETMRSALPMLALAPGEERIWDGRFAVATGPNVLPEGTEIVVRAWDTAAAKAVHEAGIMLGSEPADGVLRPGQPVFWCGDRIVGMPTVNCAARDAEGGSGQHLACSARFLSHLLVRGA